MPVAVRPCGEADLDVAGQIVCAAYHIPESLIALYCDQLRIHWHLQPDGWFLAVLDGTPVGFGGLIDYGLFARLGMMSVLPEVQRHGVGRALMEYLLAWGDVRGCPTIVLDATPEGAPLYEQFGFVDDGLTSQWHRQAGELPSSLYPLAPLRIDVLQAADLPALTSFDARSSGVRRARLFNLFLDSYTGRAFVARDVDKHIQGYLFVQEHTLGPWIAASEQAAEQLLRHTLAQVVDTGACNLISPARNNAAEALFEHYGFQYYRSLRYMRRGRPLARESAEIYALASYAIG